MYIQRFRTEVHIKIFRGETKEFFERLKFNKRDQESGEWREY